MTDIGLIDRARPLTSGSSAIRRLLAPARVAGCPQPVPNAVYEASGHRGWMVYHRRAQGREKMSPTVRLRVLSAFRSDVSAPGEDGPVLVLGQLDRPSVAGARRVRTNNVEVACVGSAPAATDRHVVGCTVSGRSR